MKMTKINIATLIATLAIFAGCDYAQNKEFRAERSDRQYQDAMADYSAGRLDAAISGFQKVIRSNPSNASARFQLACLLQDKKQDYLGALCCYREYLLLVNGGDKEKLAKDRAKLCEQLMASDLAKKMNLSDISQIAKELNEVQKENKSANETIAKLKERVSELESRNKSLTTENTRLRRMIATTGEDDEETSKMNVASAKEILKDVDGDRLKLSPDAKALFDEEEKASAPDIATSSRAVASDEKSEGSSLLANKPGAAEYKGPKLNEIRDASRKPPKAEPQHEERPEFYVVQEGDTLYRLALRFYGRRDAWKKIMEANKAIISSDARIRAGQKLRLP